MLTLLGSDTGVGQVFVPQRYTDVMIDTDLDSIGRAESCVQVCL